MARIHIFKLGVDKPGVAREDEPMPRPYVVLTDGTTMTYREWMDKGQPN